MAILELVEINLNSNILSIKWWSIDIPSEPKYFYYLMKGCYKWKCIVSECDNIILDNIYVDNML